MAKGRAGEAGAAGATRKPRTAVVTGAAGGIGRATVALLREKGWVVLATDVRRPRDADDHFVEADLSAAEGVEAVVKAARKAFDRLDLLVNNAAVQVCDPIASFRVEDWDRTMAVNVRAPFLLCRDLLPLLKAARGAVVNVSSVHAVATSPGMAAYVASKGAIAALTRALTLELAEFGVRVNAVLPGATDTAMLRAGLQRGGDGEAHHERRRAALERSTPLGRVGRPEEVAAAVMFLGDPEQSGFVSGASLVVDGGVLAALKSE